MAEFIHYREFFRLQIGPYGRHRANATLHSARPANPSHIALTFGGDPAPSRRFGVFMRIIDRLARYYEEGMTSRRASLETGLLLSHVREQFRLFHARGLPRRTRRILIMDFASRPAPYCGPVWIGEAIGEKPEPTGPDWIGKPAQSTETVHSVH